MPEGDSVLQLSNKLQFMVGREVTHTSIRVPRYATATFTGDYCENVWPYGKHLFMQFGEQILHTHLKMEGQWSIHYEGDKWRKPGFSARVVLRLANTPRDIEVVGHSLGNVDVYPIDNYYDHIAHLGPDILDEQWEHSGRDEAIARILARPERSIGAALLDQKNVAGIGNEYRVEACFIAGIHPSDHVAVIGPELVEKIVDISHRIMWANRNSPVRVTTGVRRAGETTYVFGRNHKRCRRCGTLIYTDRLGGPDAGGEEGELERIIWVCPHCQPHREA
ncbi:DNA-formamidopyrimidine glycosylase family protein [Corynebacterium casei]|uniref:DNA-formamidopyrimidine glycosylase family protein n=1 Tax=Corynebacterium casei TaxID=160386 RepID=UPI003F90763F